jgi:ABC-type multidrug transport system fused ATPase/permease subunit
MFTSSMDGLMTIRSFGVTNDFLVSFLAKLDAHTRASIIRLSIGQWFALRTEFVSILFPLGTALMVIVLGHRLDSSMMALSLMYGLAIAGWLQWGIRQLAEAEQLMISDERLYEYAHLPAEEDHSGKKRLVLIAPIRPIHDRIGFRNYSLPYRADLDAVLQNINVRIEPGEKLGVIGRTGAKKSSLLQGLLRLVSRSCVQS